MNHMDYIRQEKLPTNWCWGCGYGQVINSMARAYAKAGLTLEKTVMVSGIGCWGIADSYFRTNAFHGTHGRAVAFATGIKLANPELTVVVVMGDGDGVTIGGNHFIHACRRNVDLTAIICNNYNYGMTGGQYSSTTPENYVTATSRYGHIEDEMDICKLAEASGAAYVARSISENVLQTADMIYDGIQKKGFSLIEVVTACTTYFGRNNRMRSPIDLYRWIKGNSVAASAAAKMTSEQLAGKFVIGKLVDRDCKDYGARLQSILEKADGAAG